MKNSLNLLVMTASVAALSSSAFAGSYKLVQGTDSYKTVTAQCSSSATAPAPPTGPLQPIRIAIDPKYDPLPDNDGYQDFRYVD